MSWDRELQSLESAIVRLNADYDAFLYGSTSRPPVDSRKAVQQIIRHLSAQELDSAADRYRLTTLQGRYNALCERWDRLQSEKEAGKRPGVYGGFARDSRRAGVVGAGPGQGGAWPAAAPNAAAPASVQTGSALDRDAGLYERYLSARKSRGEDVSGYALDQFRKSLDLQREKLRERFGNAEIDFDVTERDGRVKLVARKRTGPGVDGGIKNEGES